RQQFYSALTRSSGETRLYAVAEPEMMRHEIAPMEPQRPEPLSDIRAGLERDRAQLSAADERMRAPLRDLPTPDLVEQRIAVQAEVQAAEAADRAQERIAAQIEAARERLVEAEARLAELGQARRPDALEV